MGSLGQGIVFLIQTLFQFYLTILILYVLLRASGVHYANPIIQFLIRASEPLIKPLRKIIPEVGKIDWAAWVVIFILQCVEVILLMVFAHFSSNILGIVSYSIVTIMQLIINIYFFAVIIFSLMTWVPSMAQTPLNHVLYHLTEPLLRLLRGKIPLLSGVDLTALIVLIILQLINIVILNPLVSFSVGLMQ